MKKYAIVLTTLALTACSTMQTTNVATTSTQAVKPQAAPAPTVAPDLTPAQQTCANLKAQFQTQLPFQVQSQLQWQAVAVKNPLQANSQSVAACQVSWHTNGFTVEKFGLTANFMTAALERLDWASNAQTNTYAADGPTGHQEALMHGNQLVLINVNFSPPAGACPTNEPIAACKFSKKKWVYDLKAWFF